MRRSLSLTSALLLATTLGCDTKSDPKSDAVPDRGGEGTKVEVIATAAAVDPSVGDQAVLDAMKGAGADLGKSTNVRWYVYFKTEANATANAAKATAAGWTIEQRQAEGGGWLCLSSKEAVPSLENIAAMRAELTGFATGLNADVDGWEAAIAQ